MGVEFDEYNELQSERTYRARKEHRCCACKETIRVGHLYVYTFVLFEREATTYKHCLRCSAMLRILLHEHRESDSDWTVDPQLDCGHTWRDVFDHEPPAELVALAFATPEEMQAEFAAKASEKAGRVRA